MQRREGGLRSPGRLWLFILAGCLVAAFLDALQSYLQGVLGAQQPQWQRVVFQGMEWLFLAALTPITYYLGNRYPLRRPGLGRALLVHGGGALLLCIGWAAMGVALRRMLWSDHPPIGQDILSWTLTSLPWSVFMYFAVLGCVHAFAYYRESRERELQTSRLSAQLAGAQLDALRLQLHPHFLFNSLNAITVLVRDQRTQAAAQMLELLADVLRHVLRRDQANEVTLGEELQLVKRYLAIEEVRFSDRLQVAIDIDESLYGALVPVFLLQPLVENALRHGVASRSETARIEIGARRQAGMLEIWVRDDGPGLTWQRAGAGVGLENTRLRLHTLYGDRAALTLEPAEGGGVRAFVQLPYHTEPEIR